MRGLTGLIISLVIVISSCQDQEEKASPSINGIWESLGSGWFMDIKDSTSYSLFDITSISCLSNHEGELDELEESLELRNDTLSLLIGVITYRFIRAEKMPSHCAQVLNEQKARDPLYNFDVFSETVKEHYAFMDLNQMNWDALYTEQRDKLNPQSTDAQLYLVIEETLEKLNDNHAFLEASEEVSVSVDEILNENNADTESYVDNLSEYGDFTVAETVTKHHLQEKLTEDSWLINWGKLTKDIGYVQVKAMWLFADLDIPERLEEEVGFVDAYVETFHKMYEGDYIKKEIEGIRTTMDKVVNDLSMMKSIVIDVRFNGGGQDAVSFEILSRFTSHKKQVATQKLRYGNQYTALLPLYINGSKDAFTKPLYILTSQQTGSAAEAFSIASMSMNNVKRIGSPTAGAMSTALEKTLPNGWSFAISNEIYMDNHGNNYENRGIPVDFDLNYPADRQTFFRSVVNDLETDKKDILKAIKMLEAQ